MGISEPVKVMKSVKVEKGAKSDGPIWLQNNFFYFTWVHGILIFIIEIISTHTKNQKKILARF